MQTFPRQFWNFQAPPAPLPWSCSSPALLAQSSGWFLLGFVLSARKFTLSSFPRCPNSSLICDIWGFLKLKSQLLPTSDHEGEIKLWCQRKTYRQIKKKKKGFYASYFKICHVFESGCCSHSSRDKELWTNLQNFPQNSSSSHFCLALFHVCTVSRFLYLFREIQQPAAWPGLLWGW